jgi:hypothetical protein
VNFYGGLFLGFLEETYAFVHDGLEVFGLAFDDGDAACCLHAYEWFEFAVYELLEWVFVLGVCGHCLHVVCCLSDVSTGMVSGGRMGVRHVMSPRVVSLLGRFGMPSNAADNY